MMKHGAAAFLGSKRSTGLAALWLAFLPLLNAAPSGVVFAINEEEGGEPADSPTLWIDLGVALFLVVLGGAFAGLTIALMGQDAVHLQVIATSGEGSERKNAAKVLRLLERGKHWVLVTLLLGNVVTNETLPIVLDRSLGGGWAAVLGSTVLIVIFGEVIPQSVCVRYGLPIGANLSWVVVGLMYIFAPVAWPTAKLLDYLLGENHGTVYKKAGLKTLVTLHKTLGTQPAEQLNHDEVTIITAVLDLKAKSLRSIMTPIEEMFILSSDSVLDEETMDVVLHSGFSRIPIHAPNEPTNFVGMLLVKMLITYDPGDAKQVKDFAIATLPEALPETSCLDIINYFQEGKSHMVLVSEQPGENQGALGVVTLEDVIEELIGEEITDESDFPGGIPPKPIRRATLTPIIAQVGDAPQPDKKPVVASPKHEHHSGLAASHSRRLESLSPEQRRHFDHLGPANLASKPNKTPHTHNVVVKHGQNEGSDDTAPSSGSAARSGGDENTPLLRK